MSCASSMSSLKLAGDWCGLCLGVDMSANAGAFLGFVR